MNDEGYDVFWKAVDSLMNHGKQVMTIASYCFFALLFFFLGVFYSNKVIDLIPEGNYAKERVNPSANRDEEYKEFKEQLLLINEQVTDLANKMEIKISSNNLVCKCGINDRDISEWEVNILGRNTLGLKAGDDIILVNSYSNQLQSARFKVKSVTEDTSATQMTLYINTSAAMFLGISNPAFVGMFDLKVQK